MLGRILCALNRHVPGSRQVWNHGYRFAQCRHCRRAIVRPFAGGWRVPDKGLRIVWLPKGRTPYAMSRTNAPIRPVADLTTADFMEQDGTFFAWANNPMPPPVTPSMSGDFMREPVVEASLPQCEDLRSAV